MQNEELRRTQQALEETRDRYVDLYEFAPVGYLTLSNIGTIAEINLTGAAMLGSERCNLISRRFTTFVAAVDQDRWHRHLVHALRHPGRQECDLTLSHGDGTLFSARLDCLRQERDTVHLLEFSRVDRIGGEREWVNSGEAVDEALFSLTQAIAEAGPKQAILTCRTSSMSATSLSAGCKI